MILSFNFIVKGELHTGGMIKLNRKTQLATLKSFKDSKKYVINIDKLTITNKNRLKPINED